MAGYRKAERYGEHVRLSAPTKGSPYWRIRSDDAEIDRKIADEDVARAEAEQLRTIYEGQDPAAVAKRRFAPYRQLLDASLDPANRPRWGETNAYELAGLASKWVRPVLDGVRCAEVSRESYRAVFRRMRAEHAYGSMDRVRRLLATTHNYGIDGDWLPAKPFPIPVDEVREFSAKPVVRTSGQSEHYVPDGQRPDTARVGRLIGALEEIDWWRGLQGELAAWVGPRLGETFALRTCHVDTGQRRIAINWQYIENRTSLAPAQQKSLDANPMALLWLPGKADHAVWGGSPGVLLKRPKTGKVRTVVYPGSLSAKVEKRLAEVAGRPSPPCPEQECYDPDCALLFPAPDGHPHRRSNFGRDVARRAYELTQTDKDPKLRWPRTRDAKWRWHWHDLRHRAAVHHLDTLKLPTGDVAILLGHSEDMLLKRYYGAVDGTLERAAHATKNL